MAHADRIVDAIRMNLVLPAPVASWGVAADKEMFDGVEVVPVFVRIRPKDRVLEVVSDVD
jgi:hypothetical protein